MSYRSYYAKGDWKASCDVCGRLFKASHLKQRWDGFMVCHEDWEPRHPQDFVRGQVDKQLPPWTRDETDVFIAAAIPAIAELAIADACVANGTPGMNGPGHI